MMISMLCIEPGRGDEAVMGNLPPEDREDRKLERQDMRRKIDDFEQQAERQEELLKRIYQQAMIDRGGKPS